MEMVPRRQVGERLGQGSLRGDRVAPWQQVPKMVRRCHVDQRSGVPPTGRIQEFKQGNGFRLSQYSHNAQRVPTGAPAARPLPRGRGRQCIRPGIGVARRGRMSARPGHVPGGQRRHDNHTPVHAHFTGGFDVSPAAVSGAAAARRWHVRCVRPDEKGLGAGEKPNGERPIDPRQRLYAGRGQERSSRGHAHLARIPGVQRRRAGAVFRRDEGARADLRAGRRGCVHLGHQGQSHQVQHLPRVMGGERKGWHRRGGGV